MMRKRFNLVLETPNADLAVGVRRVSIGYCIRLDHRDQHFARAPLPFSRVHWLDQTCSTRSRSDNVSKSF